MSRLRQHARVAEGQEIAVDQAFAAVVAQPMAVQARDLAAGGLEHRLARGGIPFRGGSEARIEIGVAFRHQAEFERAADSGHAHEAQACAR